MHPIEAQRMAEEDAAYEQWAAEHAEQLVENDYQEWAANRREDGEDDSREAYDQWIESQIPDD